MNASGPAAPGGRCTLEIVANSLASALAAQAGGADRVELCENLGEGGTTPSYGTLAMARDRVRIPLHVLVRPRAGDFLYGDEERETMLRDIELCVRLGCDGVVIGALDADGRIDSAVCNELIAAAGSLGVTFHRAFDATPNAGEALEAVIALGCERVLTSGGRTDARQGAPAIAELVRQAAGRLAVMAGAGITVENIAAIVLETGARELHASCKGRQLSTMRFRNDALQGLSPDWMQTQAESVRSLRQALSA
jgi:copper homeostasis protein